MEEKQHAKTCCSHKDSKHYHQPCTCDGYHTFDELYEHRITLFIALCRYLSVKGVFKNPPHLQSWRSTFHSDGTEWRGWFILGIGKKKGEQITYHLPESKWSETDFAETLPHAPEFDGHTSEDVLQRLKRL